MISDLLGPNLQSLFDYCGRQFNTNTLLWIGGQMISLVEKLHCQEFIHRDLKPECFLIGQS